MYTFGEFDLKGDLYKLTDVIILHHTCRDITHNTLLPFPLASSVQPRFIFCESFMTFEWLYPKTMLQWLINATATSRDKNEFTDGSKLIF